MFSLIPWRRERNSGTALAQSGDPFSAMTQDFQTLFDRLFGEGPLTFAEVPTGAPAWGLDVEETEKEVVVRAELPGFEVNDLNVHLIEDVLTIEAKHEVEEGKEGKEKSRRFNHVRRSLSLPAGLDAEKIEASYRNGILELHLPRVPEAQPRRIEIKS